MPSAAVDPRDLVDGLAHRPVLGQGRLPVGQPRRLGEQAGNSAEHQPPLRPEAPYPATSASSTAIRSDGSASAR